MPLGAEQLRALEQARLRVQRSQEVVDRATAVSDAMRRHAITQRARIAEQRRRWTELRTGDSRLERLQPVLEPPADRPVRMRVPAGRAAVLLLCGTCDEVLAVGTYAEELDVTLRCFSCLGYNRGVPPAA